MSSPTTHRVDPGPGMTAPPTHGLRLTAVVVVGLHVVGLALLAVGLVAGPGGGLTVGMALVAYLLGLRHAADADHISMIDNSTRKFLAHGQRHASVGLAFSAGHSTVVITAGIAVVAGAAWIRAALEPEGTAARVLGIVGGSMAGLYLLAVAAANLPQIAATVRAIRSGDPVAPAAGLWSRALAAPLAKVTHPAHVYVFGILFGLGFDTASSVSILMLTGAATAGMPGVPIAMLALPVMFAAAMALGDTVNGLLMLRIYTAAISDRRRAWFNLVITTISVASALVIAAITLSGVLVETFGVPLPGVSALAEVDTEWWGVGLIAVLLVTGGAFIAVLARKRRLAPTS